MVDVRDLAHDDGGTTLIEVLIAIVIMGIAFASLLLGIQVGITSSDAHRRQADANTVLVSASEKVKASAPDGVAYQSCARGESNPGGINAGGTAYQTAARTVAPLPKLPNGGTWPSTTIHVDLVEYWQPLTNTFSMSSADCLDSNQVARIQRVTLRVVSPTNVSQVVQRLTIIKRDESAP